MDDQALCSECHSPLTADAVGELCPQCVWNRRILGSPRRLACLLLLLGGGWSLLWMTATVWFIVQANLEPGAGGGEYAGDAVMGVMMTVPGLILTGIGIWLVRASRKARVADEGKRDAAETGASRNVNSLAVAALALGVLGLMFAPLFGPASILCGILALRTPGIDSRNRAFAWAGITLGAVDAVPFLVQLLWPIF